MLLKLKKKSIILPSESSTKLSANITGFVSLDCAMNFFTVHGFFVQEEPHPHPSIHLKLASFFHKTTKNNKTKKN